MSTNALNCPTCGASLKAEETCCRYCSTRLAKVACPHCFGVMYVGSRFCAHCGRELEKPAEVAEPEILCVDCKVPMHPARLGATVVHECDRCHSLWMDGESFRRVCAENERQTDVLGASHGETDDASRGPQRVIPVVRYRACPVCARLMNRSNYAGSSRIVQDICKSHGVWFDREELRHVVEFIRSGKAEIARQRERDHEAEKKRWQRANRPPEVTDAFSASHGAPFTPHI